MSTPHAALSDNIWGCPILVAIIHHFIQQQRVYQSGLDITWTKSTPSRSNHHIHLLAVVGAGMTLQNLLTKRKSTRSYTCKTDIFTVRNSNKNGRLKDSPSQLVQDFLQRYPKTPNDPNFRCVFCCRCRRPRNSASTLGCHAATTLTLRV